MNRAAMLEMLEQEEGFRQFVYDDATGKPLLPGMVAKGHPTVGIGRALDVNGITKAEARYLCENDIGRCEGDLDRNLRWWRELTEARQQVLCSMVFQLGWPKVSQFVKFRAALIRNDWPGAAQEMRESAWAQQTPARVERLAAMMEKG